MPITTYGTNAGRINEIKGEILAHAIPVEVLALGAKMKEMPKRQGDNITYRRYIPFGATTTSVNTQNRPSVDATAHILQEGVTPEASTLTPVDVNVVMQQYGCLYSYTDKAAELYEDDIPEEQKIQAGERMSLVREMVRYGVMKACTNVIYSGGTSRATVDEIITLKALRRMARILKLNHATKKSRILAPSANYDTSAVEAAFCVFVSTDAEPDIRDLPHFTPVAKYANRSPISEHEIGSVEEFRFVTSPELTAYADSGATVGGLDLYSTTGTSADVYPFIIMGEDAVYDVALRGMKSFDLNHIPHTTLSKSDPLNQRGYVSCKFWAAATIVNGGWMGVIEAGVTTQT
jgi:N4-gp56 family major capsid protein